MGKAKRTLKTFLSEIKLFLLRAYAVTAIRDLKKSKKKLYHIHIENTGISDDAITGMVIRDSEDRTKEVIHLLKRIRLEKSAFKVISEAKVLCS